MFYLTCTMVSSVDLAQYGVSSAKDWASVECGTSEIENDLSACTGDNPLAKARGLSLRTCGQTMIYFSPNFKVVLNFKE